MQHEPVNHLFHHCHCFGHHVLPHLRELDGANGAATLGICKCNILGMMQGFFKLWLKNPWSSNIPATGMDV
jgi:hypothetical protein